jgi:hypothetical protein
MRATHGGRAEAQCKLARFLTACQNVQLGTLGKSNLGGEVRAVPKTVDTQPTARR